MTQALPAIRIEYDGLDARHQILGLHDLSRSMAGLSRLFNAATYLLYHGEPPPRRFKPPIHLFARPIEHGSVPFDVVPYYADGTLQFLTEAIAAMGVEVIQRIATIAILFPSGRSREIDPHFEALMELMKKIQEDATAAQELQLIARDRSEERLVELVKEVAKTQKPAVVNIIYPIGKTCSEAKIGDLNIGGVEVDIPTAKTIRSKDDLELTDLHEFVISMDGVIAHNKTCKFYLGDDDTRIITGDLLDPAADIWPNNIYKDSIRFGKLRVTAKATLKDGVIQRLAIFDAKKME